MSPGIHGTEASALVSVILPTRNEAANIEEVLGRIDALGLCHQIVVVDDSDDDTAGRARAVEGLACELIVHQRVGSDRQGGLGTAIVAGIERSAGEVIVVMDADLQHPPELIPTLVEPLDRVDLSIASRFNWDNVIAGLSPIRRVASRAAGRMAFALFPGALREVSDPMSGFFAVRRASLDVGFLNPLGYKILLEILGTHRHFDVEEVPFSFGRRLNGESKAGLAEGTRFVRHLIQLRRRTRHAGPTNPPSTTPQLADHSQDLDRMRILFHASRDLVHPHAGGSEVYMDHVMQGLHDRGHTVHFSVGRPAGKHRYEVSESGGTFTQYPRSPLKLLRERKRYDLVVDVANGMTYYSPLVRSGPTICLVHHIHTAMWTEWFSPPVAAFGRFLETKMMPLVYRSATFVAVSDSTKAELVELGVKSSNIKIVHNATLVPDQPSATRDRQPLFVAVGRLVPHKQLHLLLERWPEVRAITGGRLVIVGEGPERARLKPLLSEGASLAGKVSDVERDELLARATVLLHPSHVEGWGLVVMEAAAQQTPTIGFDVAGVRDSVRHDETGWLCSDLDDFVQRWIRSAQDPGSTELVGKRAREWSESFGVERMVDAFEAVALTAVGSVVDAAPALATS